MIGAKMRHTLPISAGLFVVVIAAACGGGPPPPPPGPDADSLAAAQAEQARLDSIAAAQQAERDAAAREAQRPRRVHQIVNRNNPSGWSR